MTRFPCTAGELADGPIHDAAQGRKDDTGKPRLDLIAPELIHQYSQRNWENGMAWGRVFGATMRHLWAWWGGQARDPETGLSHLAHAACGVMFLLAYETRNIGNDDRRLK